MMTTQYRTYLFAFGMAVASWGLVSVTSQEADTLAVTAKNSIDFFSNGYRKKEMNLQGEISSELVAVTMSHDSDDLNTHLVDPFMTLHNKTPSPWLIKSEKGVLAANGEDLFLGGKVHIQREAAIGVKPLIVNTSDLNVNLPTSFAHTSEWAEIIGPPNRTTGVGMKVTFIEPIHLRLLAKVKGRYELN
jgi:lipopolysaccharide export system protein LptC